MARALGLDIGSRTIKIVELTGSAKAFKVQRVVIREIPDTPAEPEEGQEAASPGGPVSGILRDVFDSLKLPRTEVCATFPSGDTIFREITVPFTDEDQIRKVVRFEAENHLHSHSIEDVVVNWIKTGENRDGSRLTIFASPKDLLVERLATMRAAGIEPASVDLDGSAVFTAYEAAGVFRDHPNVVIIDIGAHSSSLLLVANGRPLTMRSFRLGTDLVVEHTSRELQVAPAEARRRVRLPEGPRSDDLLVPMSELDPPADETEKSLSRIEGEAVADQRLEFVRKLHRESIRSLAAVQNESAPDRILLLGGGSLLPGLSQALEERFRLPVERVDLAQRVEWRDRGQDTELTQAVAPAAIGGALRVLGYDPLGVELLQDELAPTNRFDVLKHALATGVTLLFFVLLALALVAMTRRDAERGRFSNVVGKAISFYRTAELAYLQKVEAKTAADASARIDEAVRNAPPDYRMATWLRSRLLDRFNTLQSNLGLRRDIPQVQSALQVWLELVRALNRRPRAEYGYLKILRMDIKAHTTTIRVEVEDPATFDKVRQQIEDSPYFKERSKTSRVIEPGATQNQGGRQQRDFNLRFKEED